MQLAPASTEAEGSTVVVIAVDNKEEEEEDAEDEELRLRSEHFTRLIAAMTDALRPPIDAVCPAFPPVCRLLRPGHAARVGRWLRRSSLLVRRRAAVLRALGVSEPTWAQLHVSAGGADRRAKAPTLTIGDAAAANVALLASQQQLADAAR